MQRSNLIGAVIFVIVAALMLIAASCFGSNTATNGSATPAVVKPQPHVENVVATTSGTQSAYYTTLDITVKNEGAEGTILVQASITQNGKTSQNEMPVFLKQGETHELKLTFPLVWQGGEFTSNVQTVIP